MIEILLHYKDQEQPLVRRYPEDTKVIDLHGEDIVSIDFKSLAKLQDLEYLNLWNTCLDSLDLDAISSCQRIRDLRISVSELDNLEAFKHFPCLQNLSMQIKRPLDFDTIVLEENDQLDTLFLVLTGGSNVDISTLARLKCLRWFWTRYDSKVKYHFNKAYLHANYPSQVSSVISRSVLYDPFAGFLENNQTDQLREVISQMIKIWNPNDRFGLQLGILACLGLGDLSGLDVDLRHVMERLPSGLHSTEFLQHMRNIMIVLTKEQISTKGSTVYFDIKELADTSSAILITDILERRKREVHEAVILSDGKRINLKDLWYTSYGFTILSSLGCRFSIRETSFTKVESAFHKAGFDLEVQVESDYRLKKRSIRMSRALRKHINRFVLKIWPFIS